MNQRGTKVENMIWKYGDMLYPTCIMTVWIVGTGRPQIGPRPSYQTMGKQKHGQSQKKTHTHKINLLLTPFLTLPGRIVQTSGERLQLSNPGGITRLSSSKMTPRVSSILHLSGEHLSLYISGDTKKSFKTSASETVSSFLLPITTHHSSGKASAWLPPQRA